MFWCHLRADQIEELTRSRRNIQMTGSVSGQTFVPPMALEVAVREGITRYVYRENQATE